MINFISKYNAKPLRSCRFEFDPFSSQGLNWSAPIDVKSALNLHFYVYNEIDVPLIDMTVYQFFYDCNG